MPPILSRDLIRQLDARAIEEFGIPGVVLMENAGRGVAERLRELGVSGCVVLCCGKGNNGGDGFVIARHLHNWGHEVRLICADPLAAWSGDARVHADIAAAMRLPMLQTANHPDLTPVVANADWIVDAILGTGAAGPPRPPWNVIVPQLNQSPARRLAVDVPTGLDCQSGAVHDPVFEADHTCTFVAAKPGLLTAEGRRICGQLHIVDIGAPRQLIEELLEQHDSTKRKES